MMPTSLEAALKDDSFNGIQPFELLRQIAALHNSDPKSSAALDAIIRALDRKSDFPEVVQPIVDSLAVAAGLYPYVNTDALGTIDNLTVELNRPLDFGADVIFHEKQSSIYRMLMEGQSVILSAPTSFGKSLVIDAIIASKKYTNIVVVVPTIALIDETRRRLQKFRESYKVITHGSQERGERNVFVLTQERTLDFELPEIDFFVIDEFYKLGMDQDSERAGLLNLAFYKLKKTAKAFYLLGPSIQAITDAVQGNVNASFVATDYKTVVSEVISMPKSQRTKEHLVNLALNQTEPTLIFVKSPNAAREIGKLLSEALGPQSNDLLSEAADWVAGEYHPEWSYCGCLRAGIALHHGRIPRALQQLSVRLFNEGALKFLVCTSTLIEGVNTAAKTVIIFDNKIATRKYDFFTFNNIKGRAGRMRRHFVGQVFLFNDPPPENLPTVDIPILSQPDDLPLQVVVEMDEKDLTLTSLERLSGVRNQDVLPIETIKQNIGVDPELQVQLARDLRLTSDATLRLLAWNSYPNSQELRALCNLMFSAFLTHLPSGSTVSAAQLQRNLRMAGGYSVKQWIDQDTASSTKSADEVVEGILDFLRNYCGFKFPRYARAVERIVRHEQTRRNLPQSNFGFYIGRVESMFQPPVVAALDEFGIPMQISAKLASLGRLSENIDEAVKQVEQAAVQGSFSNFERSVVIAALRGESAQMITSGNVDT